MTKKKKFRRTAASIGISVAVVASVMTSGGISTPALASTTTPFVEGWPAWPAVGIINPFSPNAITLGGYINSPLAYYTQDNNSYIPEVGASWNLQLKPGQANNAVLTLHLRRNAKWSDGSPITSKDVKMSLELGFILGSQVSTYIDSISTPDPYTVIVKQNSKEFNLFEQQILTTTIYSSNVWGKYVPKNVQQTYLISEGTGAAATKASTTLGNLAKQIAAVNIKHYISDGPFTLGQVSSNQILLPKNNMWWGAKNVHVPEVELLAANGNSQSFAYAMGGRVDYLTTYAPPTVVDPFLSIPGNHIAAPNGNYGPGLYFNTSVQPYNNVAVRQAFAYIINRSELEKIAYPTGTSSVKAATPTPYPSGLPVADYNWLTPQTMKKMNPYNKNLTMAAHLLQSVGMKKVKGSWTWKGKPFSVEIACPGGYTDWVAIAENAATQLSQFGINAQIRTADVNTYFTKLPTGTYPLAIGSVGGYNLDPWYDFQQIISSAEGLSIDSTGKINRVKTSYNWGPVVNVTGVGRINVVDLWNQLVSTTDVKKEKSNVNELALAVNQQLPVIDLLYNKFYAVFYSTKNWTGYPDSNNPLWDPNVASTSALMFIEQGYIRPAQ